MNQHPPCWWYRIAERLFPDRCREIPEAVNPDRIVLRQVALWKRYVYLQQFASDEDMNFAHSHQWRRTIAIGLWGSYTEERLAGPFNHRSAPYLYTMDASVIHRVQAVTPGHTSIFVGLWRDDDLKNYYDLRTIRRALWSNHITRFVKRI